MMIFAIFNVSSGDVNHKFAVEVSPDFDANDDTMLTNLKLKIQSYIAVPHKYIEFIETLEGDFDDIMPAMYEKYPQYSLLSWGDGKS